MNDLGFVESEFFGVPIKIFPAFSAGVELEYLRFAHNSLSDSSIHYFPLIINEIDTSSIVGCIVKKSDLKKFLTLLSFENNVIFFHDTITKENFLKLNLMVGQKCQFCGNDDIFINSDIYNTDSVVCPNCFNRPFLNRDILDQLEILCEQACPSNTIYRELFSLMERLIGLQCSLKIFKSTPIFDMMKHILLQTTVGQAIDDYSEQVKVLIETKSNFNFQIYQNACFHSVCILFGCQEINKETLSLFDYVKNVTNYINQEDC